MRLKIFIVLLVFVFSFGVFSLKATAQIALPPDGSVIVSDGTVYLVDKQTKRGFPTASVFFSHGYVFSQLLPVDSSLLSLLPEGELMTYRDGSLVKGVGPTVYLISNGEKRPFSSGEVFLGLGYLFVNILSDENDQLSNLSQGAVIDSVSIAHPAGTLVNDNGTIFLITNTGKEGIPNLIVFNDRRYHFEDVVSVNAADRALPELGLNEVNPPVPPVPNNQPPSVPQIVGATEIEVSVAQTYSFVTSDPEGDQLVYTVNWGDGTPAEVNSFTSGVNFSASHIWNQTGSYDLMVSVDDGQGNVVNNTLVVQVKAATNFAHTPTIPEITGPVAAFPKIGENFTFSSSDLDGDNLSFTIDWGDGSTQELAGASVSAVHGWTFIGDYTISVSVSDGTGNVTQATRLIKVNSDPSDFGPAITVLGPNGGEEFSAGDIATITWRRNWTPLLEFEKRVNIYHTRDSAKGILTLIRRDFKEDKYSWLVTDEPLGDDYRIEVTSLGSAGGNVPLNDRSDAAFVIK